MKSSKLVVLSIMTSVFVALAGTSGWAAPKSQGRGKRTQQADLKVSVADTPDPYVYANDIQDGREDGIVYTIRVVNGGPDSSPSGDVDIFWSLSSELISLSTGKGSCTLWAESSTSPNATCSLGSLTNGQAVDVVVRLRPCFADSPTTFLWAHLRHPTWDPDHASNDSSQDTTVLGFSPSCT